MHIKKLAVSELSGVPRGLSEKRLTHKFRADADAPNNYTNGKQTN